MEMLNNFSEMFISVWNKGILGVDIFQILIGLGIFFIFLIFRGLISKLIIKKLEIISKRTTNKLDDTFVSALIGPARFLPIVLGFFIASYYMTFSIEGREVVDTINRTLITILIFWVIHQIIEPISEEEIKKFDNYKLDQLEKFICKNNENSKQVNKINDNFDLIQILGNKFENKEYAPLINQDTGFNLSILKCNKGQITNLKFEKPTILFSRTGKWEIMIDDFQCILNPKDTISIPINSNVNIKINEQEDCYLNCVTQI